VYFIFFILSLTRQKVFFQGFVYIVFISFQEIAQQLVQKTFAFDFVFLSCSLSIYSSG